MESNKEKVKVFFSGLVFAKILNDAAKSMNFEDGILCGENNLHVVSSITDSQDKDIEKQEITVQSTISTNKSFSFYDQFGGIDEETLVANITKCDSTKRLVGWYKVRRNTSPNVSLRERAVIRNLLDGDVLNAENLLFLVITPTNEENKSTHNFNYKCFLCHKGKDPVPIKATILNLGDEEGSSQSKYKRRSRLIEEGGNSSFANVLRDREGSKFFNAQTGSSVIADNTYSMFKKTCSLMLTLQQEVTESYQNIEEYENAISELEKGNR